jgi:hypothetical protein
LIWWRLEKLKERWSPRRRLCWPIEILIGSGFSGNLTP